MLKLSEEKSIVLQQSRKDRKLFRIEKYSAMPSWDICDWESIYLKEKLTPDTDIEQFFVDIFKKLKDKPKKESIESIKLYLHEQKEQLIKNRESNKEYTHIIKFGNLVLELENLLNKNIYVAKNKSVYTMLHNDDVIDFGLYIDFNALFILEIEINKTKICALTLQRGKDIDIKYLSPNFTFDNLISLINNSIDILNIRNQKIEVKRNEFKKEIKNFYNEEKMEDLIKRIKENV